MLLTICNGRQGLKKVLIGIFLILSGSSSFAQNYPQGYFRNPLDIPMALVANFGEIRPNHWHMGLDIRTQQKVNLPVHAAADGYIARAVIEPGGFGQAIYINHPNGLSTLYAHLNSFFPALAQYVKSEQYRLHSWQVSLDIPSGLFPVKKGELIALSGSTGGSQGPHVHFEIRDTKTDNCLNPLLFGLPVADAVPPTIARLALYNRNKSVYNQTPQLYGLRKSGATYAVAGATIITVKSNKISFAIGTSDRLSNSNNPNGTYCARVLVDAVLQSEFELTNIGYDKTRYINAQVDYKYKYNGGPYVQHISPLPGDKSGIYKTAASGGIIELKDNAVHHVVIEAEDPNRNSTHLQFDVQYDGTPNEPETVATEKLLPNNVNVFERTDLEVYTSEYSVYDTVNSTYEVKNSLPAGAVSPVYSFCSAAIPVQDSITIRLKSTVTITDDLRDHIIIKNTAGKKTYVAKARWQNGWLYARFRDFGTYQAFKDKEPPTINSIGSADTVDLRRSPRIVFIPKDNFEVIHSFRAELDGKWLMFTNDKGRAFIYSFDENFPPGVHQLTVSVQDEAGNVTTKAWYCRR